MAFIYMLFYFVDDLLLFASDRLFFFGRLVAQFTHHALDLVDLGVEVFVADKLVFAWDTG